MTVESLRVYYQLATDVEREEGAEWYPGVRALCRALGRSYGLPLEQVGGALAALSPRQHWNTTLYALVQLLGLYRAGLGLDGVTVAGVRRNVESAWDILTRGDMSALRGPKVTAFADNIINPQSERVTVDTWAWRAALGDLHYSPGGGVPVRKYTYFEDMYREAAAGLAVPVVEFQAVVWLAVRRLVRIDPSYQSQMVL